MNNRKNTVWSSYFFATFVFHCASRPYHSLHSLAYRSMSVSLPLTMLIIITYYTFNCLVPFRSQGHFTQCKSPKSTSPLYFSLLASLSFHPSLTNSSIPLTIYIFLSPQPPLSLAPSIIFSLSIFPSLCRRGGVVASCLRGRGTFSSAAFYCPVQNKPFSLLNVSLLDLRIRPPCLSGKQSNIKTPESL